jgi:hypothetical protein
LLVLNLDEVFQWRYSCTQMVCPVDRNYVLWNEEGVRRLERKEEKVLLFKATE